MTEKKLLEYFENKITAEQLSVDLKDSQKETGIDTTSIYIDSLKEGDFQIKKEHLIQLFDDAISQKLTPADLTTIAFTLFASDHFNWDTNTEDGDIIADVIFALDNPEIGHDLSAKNIQLWKQYLKTGEYKLDNTELKLKFRGKGKYKELYQAIDEILWKDWDPLCVNEFEEARDEYQSYTLEIIKLKVDNVDREIIAQKLNGIAISSMGLTGNIDHCRTVADQIISLKSSI
jgi:hypothetical protein